jgi:hypothetical protein
MARQLEAPEGEVRVLFTAAEAEGFLRGWTPLPEGGHDDPLGRAISRVLKGVAMEFAAEIDDIEVCVEPAARTPADAEADGGVDRPSQAGRRWYVVRFQLTGCDASSTEQQAALASWVAAHSPALAFAVEGEPTR